MKLDKLILNSLVLLFCLISYGQEKESLQNKSTDQLFELYEESLNKDRKIAVMKEFLFKAKKAKSKQEIITGYYILAGLYEDTRVLAYSDSIINLTSKKPDKYHPALDFLTKAYFYQDKNDYINAIDNYLFVNKFSKKEGNLDLIVLSNYSIGALKRKIKEYKSALRLLKDNLTYGKNTDNQHHVLRSLIEISNIYTEIQKTDSLKVYSSFGKKLALELKDTLSYHHLLTNETISDYYDGNIDDAILGLQREKKFFERKKETKYLLYPYFYLASAYNIKRDKKTSIKYFKKVDSIFQLEKSISPFIRDTYKVLINYTKETKNLKGQLTYVNRLITFDSIINNNNFYLNKQIYKEYDIPKLKAEKKVIIETMKRKNNNFLIVIIVLSLLLLLALVISFHQYKKRKLYKIRVEEIMTATAISSATTVDTTTDNNKDINVPKEIIDDVLLKLEKFELEKKYLSKKITLNSLAKDLNSNTNYLSKIINHYKGMSFSNYLNSLRINFIVNELKVNNLYRKFTIKAIAEEAGFNNTESFSKAFYKITNVKPSYFMKQLEENY